MVVENDIDIQHSSFTRNSFLIDYWTWGTFLFVFVFACHMEFVHLIKDVDVVDLL